MDIYLDKAMSPKSVFPSYVTSAVGHVTVFLSYLAENMLTIVIRAIFFVLSDYFQSANTFTCLSLLYIRKYIKTYFITHPGKTLARKLSFEIGKLINTEICRTFTARGKCLDQLDKKNRGGEERG